MCYNKFMGENNMNYTLKFNSSNIMNIKYNEISNGLYEEKKSKFYSYIFEITSRLEAIEKINKVKEDNKSARHIVYIYSIKETHGINICFSDDGEPQGTGTKAIYETLQKSNITNICIVIVRYFGGILLGAGPLSRAYLKSYKEAEKMCIAVPIYNFIDYSFRIAYSKFNKITSILKDYIYREEVIILNKEFKDIITLNLRIREDVYIKVLNEISSHIK